MAVLLHRLGHSAYRHRKLVLGIWLVVLAGLVTCVSVFGGKLDDRFTVPGTESQRALDTLGRTLPEASGAGAQVVFTAPEGHRVTEEAYGVVIAGFESATAKAPQVSAVIGPAVSGAVSADGSTAIVQVQYSVQRAEVRPSSLDAIKEAAGAAERSGLRTLVGGSVFGSNGVHIGPSEIIGVVIAVLVLVVTFGSLLAAGRCRCCRPCWVWPSDYRAARAGPGGQCLLHGGHPRADAGSGRRHRLRPVHPLPPPRAARPWHGTRGSPWALANGTAGSAVVFAGSTVIIALAALGVIGIPFLTTMGLGAAGAVLIAVLAAVTLLPAVAGFAGARLTPKPGSKAAQRATDPDGSTGRVTLGVRWVKTAVAKPWLTVLAVVGILTVLALPVTDLRLALPDNGAAPVASAERKAYDVVSDKFRPGFNGPLLVLTETGHGSGAQAGAQAAEKLGI